MTVAYLLKINCEITSLRELMPMMAAIFSGSVCRSMRENVSAFVKDDFSGSDEEDDEDEEDGVLNNDQSAARPHCIDLTQDAADIATDNNNNDDVSSDNKNSDAKQNATLEDGSIADLTTESGDHLLATLQQQLL